MKNVSGHINVKAQIIWMMRTVKEPACLANRVIPATITINADQATATPLL
jgi:hypothetical protein